LSFSSRVTRHLALCARMYPLKDRRDFIEVHRRSIIKLNLPTTLIDDIEKKEALFSEYTSAELLEIIVSFLEYNELDSSHFDRASETYQVYASSFAPQGTFRREKDGNNFRPKSTQEGDIKWQKPKHKKVKQIKNIPEEHIRNVSASPTPLSGRVSMATQQKLDSLKSHGIDIEQGVICFMCLGRHMRPACPHYGKDVDYTDLCIKAINR
jgi:hypothetical protein